MLLCPPVRRKHSITEFPGRRMLYLCVMKKHDSKEKKKKKKNGKTAHALLLLSAIM